MGATNFLEKIETTESVRQAFDKLVSHYEREYGDRDYNGTISTCSLGSCKMSFDNYSEANYKKAMKYIANENYGSKWLADYIYLGIVGYKVITIKKELLKNKPEYKLRYVVCKDSLFEKTHTQYNYVTKTEADKKAMQVTLDTGVEHCVTKEYILVNNSRNVVSSFNLSSKVYKSKPKLKDIPVRKILPIRKYLFFGWASC